jgi:GNAT superfamily N-acetyltransferase
MAPLGPREDLRTPPATFVVRPAEPRDRDSLVEQHHALNVHEAGIHPNRRTDREGGIASLAASEERVARTGGVALVAEADGRVVGHLILTFEEGPVYLIPECRPCAYVDTLFVEEALRGRGIARALIEAAEEIARAHGHHQMLLSVQAGNVVAEAAYARLGFVHYSSELIKDLRRPEAAGAVATAAKDAEKRR